MAVKNCFIRGSVVRYVQLPAEHVDTQLLEDATRRGAFLASPPLHPLILRVILRGGRAKQAVTRLFAIRLTDQGGHALGGVLGLFAGALVSAVYHILHAFVFSIVNLLFVTSSSQLTAIPMLRSRVNPCLVSTLFRFPSQADTLQARSNKINGTSL